MSFWLVGSYWLSLHGQKTLFHSSKNHLLCSQKKESHTGLARHEVEWMMTRVFVFRVNYTFKGVCACACVCVCALQFIAVHSTWASVGKSGCDWMRVWKCICVWLCVSGRRSEPLCLSRLTLILFSGLKLFFWVANRHDTCTHTDAHTLFSYLHSSSLPTAKMHH